MTMIRIGIIGVGNCASALLQGIHFYQDIGKGDTIGLMRRDIGGFKPNQISVSCAIDIDARKVGRDAAEAIFAKPNCTKVFFPDVPITGVKVLKGPVMDGISPTMADVDPDRRFVVSDAPESSFEEIRDHIIHSGTDVVINFLPVGSVKAVEFYCECALAAGVALVNAMPVFIASDPKWAARFEEKNIPIIGDDVKSQVGATIIHRALMDLFRKRGVKCERTYQLNTGGNTDFLNMLERSRLSSKRISKTEAVQSVSGSRLPDQDIHVGPSDYVSWQNDNKVCFIRMEGSYFGGTSMDLELRLSVEDSPNSAGAVIDAVRYCKLALDRGKGGVLNSASAFLMKHPPQQMNDEQAFLETQKFIDGERED